MGWGIFSKIGGKMQTKIPIGGKMWITATPHPPATSHPPAPHHWTGQTFTGANQLTGDGTFRVSHKLPGLPEFQPGGFRAKLNNFRSKGVFNTSSSRRPLSDEEF
jgi:hypothetical protein